MKFNERLRELRKENNLSQAELASQTGLSKSSINMYERGEREPGIETLELLADYFNCDMNYLIGKSNIKNAYLSNKHHPIDNMLQMFSSSISDDEHDMLQLYRRLDDNAKALIKLQIHGILDGGEK